MSNRITYTIVSNPANAALPAYALDDGMSSARDLIAAAIARKNQGSVMAISSEGHAADRSYFDYRAVISTSRGKMAVTFRVRHD